MRGRGDYKRYRLGRVRAGSGTFAKVEQFELSSMEKQLSANQNGGGQSAEELEQLQAENETLQTEIESLEEQVLRLNAK